MGLFAKERTIPKESQGQTTIRSQCSVARAPQPLLRSVVRPAPSDSAQPGPILSCTCRTSAPMGGQKQEVLCSDHKLAGTSGLPFKLAVGVLRSDDALLSPTSCPHQGGAPLWTSAGFTRSRTPYWVLWALLQSPQLWSLQVKGIAAPRTSALANLVKERVLPWVAFLPGPSISLSQPRVVCWGLSLTMAGGTAPAPHAVGPWAPFLSPNRAHGIRIQGGFWWGL